MVSHPGLTPNQEMQKKQADRVYDKAMQMLKVLRDANMDMVKDGDNLIITIDNGMQAPYNQKAVFTFDLMQSGHNFAEEMK